MDAHALTLRQSLEQGHTLHQELDKCNNTLHKLGLTACGKHACAVWQALRHEPLVPA